MEEKRHKVSVIIPNYNYGRFLREAIESVLAQTYLCHEVIVVDDGSTDDSLTVAAQFSDRVHIVQQKNSGVGAARNNGVKNSTGDLLAFLDADDIWLPHKIERQIACLEKDAEIGLVSCAMREFALNRQTLSEYKQKKNGWCAKEILLFETSFVFSGSAIFLPRSVFEQSGGFDENKEMHPSEDWEFCYRVSKSVKFVSVAEILVDYRNHGGNGHLKIPRMERAMMLAYDKIFRDADIKTLQLRRTAYGNLHTILAGSYFRARNYPAFIKHTAQALRHTPQNIRQFLMFPIRVWKRNFSGKQALPE